MSRIKKHSHYWLLPEKPVLKLVQVQEENEEPQARRIKIFAGKCKMCHATKHFPASPDYQLTRTERALEGTIGRLV